MNNRYFVLFSILLFSTCLAKHSPNPALSHFKEFEIVVPSYNNEKWVELNLSSLCFQNYPRDKFHITYINDASTDKTKTLVEEFIKKHHLENLVTVINNPVNKKQMENRYKVFHTLQDHKIIAECDGDDWWSDHEILNTLNECYQDPTTWILCTKHKNYPSGNFGPARPFPKKVILNNSFRLYKRATTPMLRTYYAWLFKQIKLKDLLYEGIYYPVVTDPAYTFPMMEMAGFNSKFLPQVCYIRNRANELNVSNLWKIELTNKVHAHIVNSRPYKRLDEPKLSMQSPSMDAIVIASNHESFKNLLRSISEKVSNLNKVHAIYSDNKKNRTYFRQITEDFKHVNFVYFPEPDCSLQESVKIIIEESQSTHFMLFADDKVKLLNQIDAKECASAIKSTFANAFYLTLGHNNLKAEKPYIQFSDSIFAWQYRYTKDIWQQLPAFSAIAVDKKAFKAWVERNSLETLEDVKAQLENIVITPDDVGLFYHDIKAVMPQASN